MVKSAVCVTAAPLLLLAAVPQLAALKLVPAHNHGSAACCVSANLQLLAVQKLAAAVNICCACELDCCQAGVVAAVEGALLEQLNRVLHQQRNTSRRL